MLDKEKRPVESYIQETEEAVSVSPKKYPAISLPIVSIQELIDHADYMGAVADPGKYESLHRHADFQSKEGEEFAELIRLRIKHKDKIKEVLGFDFYEVTKDRVSISWREDILETLHSEIFHFGFRESNLQNIANIIQQEMGGQDEINLAEAWLEILRSHENILKEYR